MYKSLGNLNRKEVIYIANVDTTNLVNILPKRNWLLLAIANKSELPLSEELAKVCLDNNVLYICGTGEASSEIDDLFDFEIVDRKIAQNSDDYEDAPMTTFENRIDEQLWYAGYVATHDTESIETIVCINLTQNDYKREISDLIIKMNAGWIPED